MMSLTDTPCFFAAVVDADLVEWAENWSVFTPAIDNISFIHLPMVAEVTALWGLRTEMKRG